jgi:hypothetical protein
LGEGHEEVTEVALEREEIDPVDEKRECLSLEESESSESASESAASGELAKQARSVRRLRSCERRPRVARAMVVRMAVLISTTVSFSPVCSSKRELGEAKGWTEGEAVQTRRCSASPAKRTRTQPGSMKRSNSRPPRAFIHVCHSMPACWAAIKIGFGGVHAGERVRHRRPEPRVGVDGHHEVER